MSGEAISRRGFIKSTALCTGGMLIFNYCGSRSSLWQYFTMHEGLTVEAISEQIIPADQDPGGRDAGVVYFIDKQLLGPYSRFQAHYRNGLASMDRSSKTKYGKKFLSLNNADQTRILEDMEQGKLPSDHWQEVSQQMFFGLLRDHSLQGYYGDPKHGGNREYVSYKMLDLRVLKF
jgi:gluconate 2-dehydrogenase gamma chain